jgi:hypothetical protein
VSVTIQDAVKEARLRTVVHKYLVANGQEESYLFLYEKTDNRKAYERYIKEDAPKQVNIPYAIRKELDKQAKASEWGAMDANLAKARKSIAEMLNADVMTRFAVSDEYKGYQLSKDATPAGKLAAALKLKSPKVEQAAGLLKVYHDARTPTEKFQAYEALVKLAGGEAKLNAAFKAAGVTAPPALKKGNPDKALAEFVRLTKTTDPKVKTAMQALLKKYNSASLRSARATVESEILKLTTKHSLNGRETTQMVMSKGGWS